MRPLYLLLYFSLRYSMPLFYKRFIVINRPDKWFGSTIFVSNHPNSFMDPLVLGSRNHAVVYFMTRSDVFKWWLKPVLWASHMLPIFRQHDGEDTKAKNSDTFKQVTRSLAKGNNILIFGEGFTDDIPVRTLKPVKKGAVRMGFQSLEALDWKKNIYIRASGINYTDRNTVRSEFLVANSDKICLNDYKEAYLANPNKVINEVSRFVESKMQETVTYVKDPKSFSFHENIMQITRRGMNHANHDDSIPLTDRWKYSQKLATWINENNPEENEELAALKNDLDSYFNLEKRMKIEDRFVLAKTQPELKNRTKELLILLFTWPFALLGAVHGLIPYLLAKTFTEKSFKRKVFWGSVKMMLGKLVGAIWNIPIIILLNHYLFPNNWIGVAYFFLIPVLCFAAYMYVRAFKEFRIKGAMDKIDVSKFVAKRADLAKRIEELIMVN